MIQLTIETAKRQRLSRNPLSNSLKPIGLIKPGEKCLVIKDFEGWKTNIDQKTATKSLNKILKQLNQKERKTAFESFSSSLKLLNNLEGKKQ